MYTEWAKITVLGARVPVVEILKKLLYTTHIYCRGQRNDCPVVTLYHCEWYLLE